MLPSLTLAEVNELVRASEGRAVSYVDEPDWYCGRRHSTHVARDGFTATEYGQGGTMQSLAYSTRDKILDYQRACDSIAWAERKIAFLMAEHEAELKRKTPRIRMMARINTDLSIAHQDRRNAEQRKAEITAKYFRGFEHRLLLID